MSETTIFPDFERDAWPLYERKGKKKLALAEWNKLSHKDRESAYDGILPYINSRPEVRFRLDFERYIKYRTWEDRIIEHGEPDTATEYVRASAEALARKLADCED